MGAVTAMLLMKISAVGARRSPEPSGNGGVSSTAKAAPRTQCVQAIQP